jgi:RNA polymerase sigma-70 factor (ECF subfamily)
MAHAVVHESVRLMAGREFETFYAASYRRLVVQLLGVTGNLHDAEDVVQEAMARAAVRWRRVSEYEVLVLHYLADLPVQEVAAELRVPVGTVSSRLARGAGGPAPGPRRRGGGLPCRTMS